VPPAIVLASKQPLAVHLPDASRSGGGSHRPWLKFARTMPPDGAALRHARVGLAMGRHGLDLS
jgi:hypothetical protein